VRLAGSKKSMNGARGGREKTLFYEKETRVESGLGGAGLRGSGRPSPWDVCNDSFARAAGDTSSACDRPPAAVYVGRRAREADRVRLGQGRRRRKSCFARKVFLRSASPPRKCIPRSRGRTTRKEPASTEFYIHGMSHQERLERPLTPSAAALLGKWFPSTSKCSPVFGQYTMCAVVFHWTLLASVGGLLLSLAAAFACLYCSVLSPSQKKGDIYEDNDGEMHYVFDL